MLNLLLLQRMPFDFAKEGGVIMIAHKWMEEPPQMEDRNQLTKNN